MPENKAKVANYTAKEAEAIKADYVACGTDVTEKAHDARAESVARSAKKFGKEVRSIRSKLVSMEVYIARKKVSGVTGEPAEKKEVIAQRVSDAFGVEVIDGKECRLNATSLEKMNKTELSVLLHRFNSEIVDEMDEVEIVVEVEKTEPETA